MYGVVSHMVSQRTHEIGIRMALGPRAATSYGLVVRQGLGLALHAIGPGWWPPRHGEPATRVDPVTALRAE